MAGGRKPQRPLLPREQRKLRLKRLSLGAGALLLVLLLGWAVTMFTPVAAVKHIEVTGNQQTSTEEIQQHSGIALGTPLPRVNLRQAAANVSQLPWVEKTTVQRKWLNTIKIGVTERQAVLWAERADGQHLIDDAGTAFIIGTPPAGTVQVLGTQADDPEVFKAVLVVVQSLDPVVRPQLVQVDAANIYQLNLIFADGRTVYWGSNEQAAAKSLATGRVLTTGDSIGRSWNVSNPELVAVK